MNAKSAAACCIGMTALLTGSCSTGPRVAAAEESAPAAPEVNLAPSVSVSQIPHAVIYRTNVDVADHVAVALTPDHSALLSFPGPGDVGENSRPVRLADGWLLDRQGCAGPDTRFLTYTYEEYSHLPSVPSPAELMRHIIPDARVTAIRRLKVTLNEALADTAAINAEL